MATSCRFDSGLRHHPILEVQRTMHAQRRAWAAAGVCAATTGLLLAGTLMPGDLKGAIEGRLGENLPWSTLGHFILFAVFGMLPVYGRGRLQGLRALAFCLVLAAATEVAQLWIPGRYPQWQDAALDLAGAAVGLAVRRLWLARRAARAL
jgi:hypothetical protein